MDYQSVRKRLDETYYEVEGKAADLEHVEEELAAAEANYQKFLRAIDGGADDVDLQPAAHECLKALRRSRAHRAYLTWAEEERAKEIRNHLVALERKRQTVGAPIMSTHNFGEEYHDARRPLDEVSADRMYKYYTGRGRVIAAREEYEAALSRLDDIVDSHSYHNAAKITAAARALKEAAAEYEERLSEHKVQRRRIIWAEEDHCNDIRDHIRALEREIRRMVIL